MTTQSTTLSTRKVMRSCLLHGDYKTEVLVTGSGDGVPVLQRSRCPVCRRERQAQRDAAARAKRDSHAALLIERSGIPPRYQTASFSSFQTYGEHAEQMARACRSVRHYADTFPDRRVKGTCLVLRGHTGTGKTHLACATAIQVIHQHGMNAVYATVLGMIKAVKSAYNCNSPVTEAEVIQRYTTPDLLVLDEVGVQQATEHELVTIYDVLNSRYEHVKPTVVISNLAKHELKHFIGARVVDRLKEGGGLVLDFEWTTYRNRV